MRYPDIPLMSRLFNLFEKLNLTEASGILIDYKFSCPKAWKMYNGIRKQIKDVSTHSTKPDKVDPFHFGEDNGGNVIKDFIYSGYQKLFSDTLTPFTTALVADTEPNAYPANAGWRKLMRFDQYSVRGYMSDCLKYPLNEISWLETMTFSTGGYSMSLAELVLAQINFGANVPDAKWYCLE